MKIIQSILLRFKIAWLKRRENGLLVDNAGYRQYIKDVDESCHFGGFMHDRMMESYLDCRKELKDGEEELIMVQLEIQRLESKLKGIS
jgi:hypothetical protein